MKQRRRRRGVEAQDRSPRRHRRIVPDTGCPEDTLCSIQQFVEPCQVNTSSLILCKSPAIGTLLRNAQVTVEFIMDNLRVDFNSVSQTRFSYEPNPTLKPLSGVDSKPYRHKPGSVISVEGENLDLAISKEEVLAMIGEGNCSVKTLSRNHLYCEPPPEQPSPRRRKKRDGTDSLPEFIVQMGNLRFMLGKVQYDTQSLSTFPLEAQIGVGVAASIVALIVLIIVLIYRRKSKQALRDYKKVQIQLENLETSVRDRCKKEFTDLMTEMMDVSSDLVGSGIPFLDYKMYAERIFFPGHRVSPLRRDLDVQECRRQTVEQGLVQLSNLLNSKLFLTKDSAGESLYMLFRAIKHQVDKGPVDAVTGKAKYTLNDNRLLREDIEYRTLTLNVQMQGGGNEAQPVQSKVLDCDTITQVKEKILDQAYKGTSFSHRPHTDSLDLDAGHLTLGNVQGTLQKFVDDLFQVILSTSRPVPLAVKYFFDLLDEQAVHHGIIDTETIHIWKTNSLPLRFWINVIKNPHFIFDVQASDNVDAVLSVIAQTFMDSCTIAEHKLGRDSPINKLLYARDIPRYKQMVERYYADIRQMISASDQEMNSSLAELSRNYSGELNYLVALHELYKYINKYYDQIITALEEDPTAQKMQLGYRLQQIAAAVENKVTDL
ncbi:UNVERIFIED_CONTAM: hypothetical protein FKN15_075884 [Acipenser sinensis]